MDTQLKCALCGQDLSRRSREWWGTRAYCLNKNCIGKITQPVTVDTRIFGRQTPAAKGAK